MSEENDEAMARKFKTELYELLAKYQADMCLNDDKAEGEYIIVSSPHFRFTQACFFYS